MMDEREAEAHLADVCSELLHFLAVFRASHGSGFGCEELRSTLRRRFTTLEQDLQTAGFAHLHAPAQRLLAYATDDLIFASDWPHAQDWEPLQAELYPHEEVVGDEDFYDCIDRASGPFADPQVQELAFLLMSIGFRGHLRTHPEDPPAMRHEAEAQFELALSRCRLHHMPGADQDFLFPQAYAHTDERRLPALPLVRALRVIAVLMGIAFFSAAVLWFVVPEGVREALETAERIIERHGFPADRMGG